MNLLLVDDHPLFGVGFAHALANAGLGIQVSTALTLDAGLEAAAVLPELEIVLVDYRLGEGNGIDGLRRFGERFPLVARVLISGDEDPALMASARSCGASGFLGKSRPLHDMVATLQKVAAGGEAFDAAPRDRRDAAAAWPTARQREVLALLALGQQNKRIAGALGIAERTVKLHVTALLQTLGARNRTHLVVLARERGLL
jgi:DNA-binding NarL/FixJ family response regulator